jgi:predicted phage-related endonuclease
LPHDHNGEIFDVEASRGEYRKISRTLLDLKESEIELVTERDELERSLAKLESERKSVEVLLNSELKPRALRLKRMLAEYRETMEVQDEFDFINGLETSMKAARFLSLRTIFPNWNMRGEQM